MLDVVLYVGILLAEAVLSHLVLFAQAEESIMQNGIEPSIVNTIIQGDCVRIVIQALPAGCVDLAFAEIPLSILGKNTTSTTTRRGEMSISGWTRKWDRTSLPSSQFGSGTFWLAIGDEYAAEMKVLSQDIGFTTRSWVIWYYTFGVNCTHKFTRSHAHLFYFVKNPTEFTFRQDDLKNRIPSARQLVYNDGRANPRGRLPDDTWILRPQDLVDCFTPAEDTWYFPRVAGTFSERAGVSWLSNARAAFGSNHSHVLKPRRSDHRPLFRKRNYLGRRQEVGAQVHWI